MRRAGAALAIGSLALPALAWRVGSERVYMEVRCRAWHLRHAPDLWIGNVSERGEDVLLARVPDHSTDPILIVLLSRSPGIFASAARDPESVGEILGEPVRLAAEPRTVSIGEMEAVRVAYETVREPRRRTVAWLFPSEPLLVSSAEVGAEGELQLDALVVNRVSRGLDKN